MVVPQVGSAAVATVARGSAVSTTALAEQAVRVDCSPAMAVLAAKAHSAPV
jgi:hypothetical protein